MLVLREDLEDPARLGIGLLRREPPQAQLRVRGTALGHEAGQDARNRLRIGGVELGQRLAGSFLLGGLLRPALPTAQLFVVDDRGAREAALVWRPDDRD